MRQKYLAQIDHPNKAYWLGFLLFQANLKKNKIIVGVPDKDLFHLQLLQKDLKLKNSLRYYGNQVYCSFESPRMKVLLAEPEDLQPFLFRHYWRGVIDSIGRIAISKKNQPILSLKWSNELCNKFKHFCKDYARVNSQVKKDSFVLRGKTAAKIINILYVDTERFLARNKQKAVQFELEAWSFGET